MSTQATSAHSPASASASTQAPSSAKGGASEATKGAGSAQAQGQGKEGQAPQSQAQGNPADDYEEIKVGGVSAKLPKDLAKAVKELERGFQSKAHEVATVKKQFQEFAKAAKDNPDHFFQEFGIDPDQYSQARLAKKLEMEMMNPHQRRAMELEAENKGYKEKEKADQEAQAKRKDDEEYQKASTQHRQQMFEAWKGSGLPPDPKFGAWMAATMAAAHEQKLNWTWDQAAAKVKEDFVGHVRALVGSLNPEQLQDLLTDAPLKKWREFDVKRVTQAVSQASSPADIRPGQAPASNRSSPSKRPALTESQWKHWRASGLPFEEWVGKHGSAKKRQA